MYRKIAIILTAMCLLLSGCTTTADRIYVVCRIDGDQVSCYKTDEKFYTLQSNGILTPSLDPTLRAYPALLFKPAEHEYILQYNIPGLYSGTLYDVEGYVFALLQNGFTGYSVHYTDYQRIELLVESDTDTYRILYNIYGEVRIYSENNLPILYINVKENI